jgi:hypothetical protein
MSRLDRRLLVVLLLVAVVAALLLFAAPVGTSDGATTAPAHALR